jgi:hypothetical protein
MAAVPGTHVHTADNAVPPLNDDLAGSLDNVYGFHHGLDLIADGVRAIALDRLDIPTTQALVTMLAGSTDQPGTQIDVSALIAALVARLLNADENPALRTLPTTVQDDARTAGADFVDHDAYVTPRADIAKTVYDLNPI